MEGAMGTSRATEKEGARWKKGAMWKEGAMGKEPVDGRHDGELMDMQTEGAWEAMEQAEGRYYREEKRDGEEMTLRMEGTIRDKSILKIEGAA